MKLFNLLISGCTVGDWGRKFGEKMFRPFLKAARIAFFIAVVFLLLEYSSPFVQPDASHDLAGASAKIPAVPESIRDSNVQRVLTLANMIRWISNDTLPAPKVLMYAGLISDAAEKYEVNPLEIIALIKIESNFKEASINTKTGDYGLGQINWEHWGRHNDLTSEDILDPAVNISMTCQVYKYFGKDFGRYHRGNGIQCEAYRANVNRILSTLNALAETLEEEG